MEKVPTHFLDCDPVERTEAYKKIKDELEKELDEMFKDSPYRGKLGFCHLYWSAKKQLLRTKYGIEWKSPAELNPTTLFD